MLEVLFKNNQLIAVNKPPGVSVQADKTGDEPLQTLVEKYCKHPVHAVNRLDRPVSGVLLFAKSKSAMAALTKQFEARTVEKEYLAVVKNAPPEPSGQLVHFLKKQESKNFTQAFSEEKPGTERAELEYKTLGISDKYVLLWIRLHSGKHHQIRAQLAAIGCPVKGDVKYGFPRGNRDRSIHLHAWRLRFDHPVNGSRISLETPPPSGDPLWQAFEI